MKGLLAGIVLIIVLGFGAFFYRNVLEHPPLSNEPTACTADAKLCPDGSAVGRTGPNCTFAICPLPNAEDPAIGVGFVIPQGYVANADAIGADETLRAVFDKPAQGEVPHSIIVRHYPVASGETPEATILAHTMYEPSGNMAKSINEFRKRNIGEREFLCVTLERFEGHVHTACYLNRESDVLRFEVLEKNVDWTNPALVIDTLPEHSALYAMLASLQTR